MPTHARAAVQTGSKRTELRDVPLPEIPSEGGVLRVLAAGVCGSDVPYYADASHGARILGHENVGVIEALGDGARARWGVREGDVVALEEYLPCGACADCRAGDFRSCARTDTRHGTLRYGWTPLEVEPGLWGGYAEYLYLHPSAMLHAVPAGVPPRLAAMALPLGNGIQWASLDGGSAPGKTVVVLGPGQQGLACVVAAKASGARVIAAGLARDAHRLAVATRLGADAVVRVDETPLAGAVREVTGGAMADLVIDVSSGGAAAVVNGALDVLAKHGTLIAAAYKGVPVDAFALDTVIRNQLTVRGVRGHSYRSIELALALMAERRFDLDALATHAFGLDDVDRALRLVGAEWSDDAIHVCIVP
ncbi:MAG TPA: zinc-binding dehydrogenase [Candidatus Elarobacter sp.]|nr:zinc-binding dehydrogenase [Candidatus Elarobacter sp.]